MGNIQIKKKHEEKKGLTWQNIFESHLARAFGIGALMRRYNNIDTARYNHVLVLPRTIYTKHLNCNAYTTKLYRLSMLHSVNENIQMIFISKEKKDNHGIHSITSPSQALNGIISNPRRHRTLEGKEV